MTITITHSQRDIMSRAVQRYATDCEYACKQNVNSICEQLCFVFAVLYMI